MLLCLFWCACSAGQLHSARTDTGIVEVCVPTCHLMLQIGDFESNARLWFLAPLQYACTAISSCFVDLGSRQTQLHQHSAICPVSPHTLARKR